MESIDEEKRLENLAEYAILDTLPEQSFDDIARLATIVCKTPIAIISFIDKNRQWFKSSVGISISETTRELSLCAKAIQQKEPIIIEDITVENDILSYPLLKNDPKIRFYFGVPLISKEGHSLGTIAALDYLPKVLEPNQKLAMQLLANQVVDQLTRHQSLRKINQQKIQLSDHSKMMALGQMTSSIAHEINNPLTVIHARASILTKLAQENQITNEVVQVNCEKIISTSTRISNIIKGIKNFSR